MRAPTKLERRRRHIAELSVIFGNTYDVMKLLFKELKEVESRGHKKAEMHCNGEICGEQYDNSIAVIRRRLERLVPLPLRNAIHLNGDPRGYFLKIDDEYMRKHDVALERDWGGYGIICPEGL